MSEEGTSSNDDDKMMMKKGWKWKKIKKKKNKLECLLILLFGYLSSDELRTEFFTSTLVNIYCLLLYVYICSFPRFLDRVCTTTETYTPPQQYHRQQKRQRKNKSPFGRNAMRCIRQVEIIVIIW